MKRRFTFDQTKAAMNAAVTRRMVEIIGADDLAELAAHNPVLKARIEYAMKSSFLAGTVHERDNLIGENWSALE